LNEVEIIEPMTPLRGHDLSENDINLNQNYIVESPRYSDQHSMFSDDNMSKNSRRRRKDRATIIKQEISIPDSLEVE
jgi:hypothetical protein